MSPSTLLFLCKCYNLLKSVEKAVNKLDCDCYLKQKFLNSIVMTTEHVLLIYELSLPNIDL